MHSSLFLRLAAAGLMLTGLAGAPVLAAAPITSLSISYAYYDPVSLALKDQGFLQAALGPNVKISWILSQGSNKALEFLRGGSIAFGQAGGSAALLARANGAPVQAIAASTNAEWTAIVVPANSPIKTLADLKGKHVAVTLGTDPNFFLLRALATVGLAAKDITIVPLQHPLGRQALDAGQVDAWAGLDPFMAEAQLQHHDILVYRNKSLISPGFLLSTEAYEAAHPEVVKQVLQAYAKARAWVIANPDATAGLVAKDAGLPLAVAKLQLSRCNFKGNAITAGQIAEIHALGPVVQNSGKLTAGADLPKAEDTLVNTSFTTGLGLQ